MKMDLAQLDFSMLKLKKNINSFSKEDNQTCM